MRLLSAKGGAACVLLCSQRDLFQPKYQQFLAPQGPDLPDFCKQ